MSPLLRTIATVLALAVPSWAVDWNVNPAGTGDFPTIQAAFDAAASGDRILLAPGTYRDSHTRTVWGNVTTAVAFISPGVSLIGVGGADVTLVDGEGIRRCLVGREVGAVEISGVTFVDGVTNGSGALLVRAGGGLFIEYADPIIDHCVFLRCTAPGAGGGGGLFVVNCPTASIRFNKFIDNFGGDLGGALEFYAVASAHVSNNTFVGNSAGDRAGAVMVNISTCSLTHNVFAENDAAVAGGAVGCLNGAVVNGSCNLFWNNVAPVDSDLYNCPFELGTANNILADPRFCDSPRDNFLLQSDSPAAPTDPSGCGLRGAYGVGCGPVSVSDSSWGQVKAHYR